MQILFPRCCELNVHKRSITGCCLWFNHTRQRQEETMERRQPGKRKLDYL